MSNAYEISNGSDVGIEPLYQQKILRIFAWIFSFLFHPLFIPVYVGYYIAFIHPLYFSGFNAEQRLMVLIRIIINMVAFPAVAVLLLKAVGFIDSIFLKNQKELYCMNVKITKSLLRQIF